MKSRKYYARRFCIIVINLERLTGVNFGDNNIDYIIMATYIFKLLDGSSFEVPRTELRTVGEARALAGRRLGIEEIMRVRLISSGRVLEDDTSLL